ncbi:MAG: hypothetical protein R6U50_02915 [Desulfobacterales bacterium]
MTAHRKLWILVVGCCLVLTEADAQNPSQKAGRLFVASDRCLACHNGLIAPSGTDVSIGSNWQASIMAHASRDPYWQASVKRETIMHPESKQHIEDECAACHMPMSRYTAKVRGQKGSVFANLPVLSARTPAHQLAADAVSCTMCHQIQPENLGTEDSFTAGFLVDTEEPLGQRPAFGPFDVDEGRTRIMRSAGRFVPTETLHLKESGMCGSCHTLYTYSRGKNGQVIGRLPEQMPYLEWRHSAYRRNQSCQSCHMPKLTHSMAITSVMGQPRKKFSRHVFRGGNFFMLNLLNRHRTELKVIASPQDLEGTMKDTMAFLNSKAARIAINEAKIENGRLTARVEITNLAGHKLPTAYPSRRVWIHFQVMADTGDIVFESGKMNDDGSIAGNDNDRDGRTYESHHDRITRMEDVPIYEAVMAGPNGRITTGLLEAVTFIKDNRLLPLGFDKRTAHPDIAVKGAAYADPDFTGSKDTVLYSIPLENPRSRLTLIAGLMYQPIAYRWAQNLRQQPSDETDRFVSLYNADAGRSAVRLTEDRHRIDAMP